MSRWRLAAGLMVGLVGGCSCMPERPSLFSRFGRNHGEAGAPLVTEGPVLDDCAPPPVGPPGGMEMAPPEGLTPLNPPRLAPVPVMPYGQ
jgi:hypothetical protein